MAPIRPLFISAGVVLRCLVSLLMLKTLAETTFTPELPLCRRCIRVWALIFLTVMTLRVCRHLGMSMVEC